MKIYSCTPNGTNFVFYQLYRVQHVLMWMPIQTQLLMEPRLDGTFSWKYKTNLERAFEKNIHFIWKMQGRIQYLVYNGYILTEVPAEHTHSFPYYSIGTEFKKEDLQC